MVTPWIPGVSIHHVVVDVMNERERAWLNGVCNKLEYMTECVHFVGLINKSQNSSVND